MKSDRITAGDCCTQQQRINEKTPQHKPRSLLGHMPI
nr:MAG TPA: hypothetical protein [Bacteriophage sp.]